MREDRCGGLKLALQIAEFFGFRLGDPAAAAFISQKKCPFVNDNCIKPSHGSCSLKALRGNGDVICCPNRLYASSFKILNDVSALAFGATYQVFKPDIIRQRISQNALVGNEVVAFGRYFGQELPLPRIGQNSGSYFLDWVLATLSPNGAIKEMTALEVQTIDTTGSYKAQSDAAFAGLPFVDSQGRSPGYSNSGFNWENVNKRILPQVIYKGHALRREAKCTKGLFFACPKAVYDRIIERLGGAGTLHSYPMHNGAITFLAYDLGPDVPSHNQRQIIGPTAFTTTVDQVALAFTSPRNLPAAGVYEAAANLALQS